MNKILSQDEIEELAIQSQRNFGPPEHLIIYIPALKYKGCISKRKLNKRIKLYFKHLNERLILG